MKTICITLADANYSRLHGTHASAPLTPAQTTRHLTERGVNASFFFGIHGPKLGIETKHTYEIDNPGTGFKIGPKPVGCWLSHRAVWAACLLLPDDLFFIIEDDAKFPENWRTRLERAVKDAGDFDILYVGSCCTHDKPKTHIAGDVYEVRWPFCTHGYVVRRTALPLLIRTQDDATLYAPIDISLALHSFPLLKTRAMLPRLLDQFGTEIPP